MNVSGKCRNHKHFDFLSGKEKCINQSKNPVEKIPYLCYDGFIMREPERLFDSGETGVG